MLQTSFFKLTLLICYSNKIFYFVFQATEVVKKEISTRGLEGRVYMAPESLRKRVEVSLWLTHFTLVSLSLVESRPDSALKYDRVCLYGNL